MCKSLRTWTLHVQYNNEPGVRRKKYLRRYKGPLKCCALWHNQDNSLIEVDTYSSHVLMSFKLPDRKIKQINIKNISVCCSKPTKNLMYLLNKRSYLSKENDVIYATTFDDKRIKLIDIDVVRKIHYICNLNTVFIANMEQILDYPNGIHGAPIILDDECFTDDDCFYIYKEQLKVGSITDALKRAFPCNSDLLSLVTKFNSLPRELHGLYALSTSLDSLYETISDNSRSIIWNPVKQKPLRDLLYTKYISQLLHLAKLYQIINDMSSSLANINSVLPVFLKYISSPHVRFCDSKVLQNMACIRYKDISIAMSRLQGIVDELKGPITEAYQDIRVADVRNNKIWRKYMLEVLKQDKSGESDTNGTN